MSPGVTCCPEPGLEEIWGRASAARRVPVPLPGSAQSPRPLAGSRGQMCPGQWRGQHDLAVPVSPRPCRQQGRAGAGCRGQGPPRLPGLRDVWVLRARRCRQPPLDPAGISTAGDTGVAWLGQADGARLDASRPPSSGHEQPGSEPLGPAPGSMRQCWAAPGARRAETAQGCEGSRQPLDVSVGLTLVPMTAEKGAEKGQEGTKI